MPPATCRSKGTWLNFQVRGDMLGRAKQFCTFEKFDLKVETPKPTKQNQKKTDNNSGKTTKGTVYTTKTWASTDEMSNYFRAKENNISSIHKIANMVKITFYSSFMPITIKAVDGLLYQVTPALYTPVRCNKCQMHGHHTAVCRATTIKCPQCAGPHSYEKCKNKNQKKCANCQDNHSAAYKGCIAYYKYTTRLAERNNQLMRQHFQHVKKDQPNVGEPLSHVTSTPTRNSDSKQSKQQIKNIVLAVLKEAGQQPPSNLDKIIEENLQEQTPLEPHREKTSPQVDVSNTNQSTQCDPIPSMVVRETPKTSKMNKKCNPRGKKSNKHLSPQNKKTKSHKERLGRH